LNGDAAVDEQEVVQHHDLAALPREMCLLLLIRIANVIKHLGFDG
jgi:hypothetical protein